MDNLNLLVFGRSEASSMLLSPKRRKDVTHIVSIFNKTSHFGSVGDCRPCSGFSHHHAKKLALCFDDISIPHDDYEGPDEDDVKKIIEFAKELKLETKPVKLLVHCAAGISRSTATAFVIMCVVLGENRERDALDKTIIATKHDPWPNDLIVSIADHLLDRNNAMVNEVFSFKARRDSRLYK